MYKYKSGIDQWTSTWIFIFNFPFVRSPLIKITYARRKTTTIPSPTNTGYDCTYIIFRFLSWFDLGLSHFFSLSLLFWSPNRTVVDWWQTRNLSGGNRVPDLTTNRKCEVTRSRTTTENPSRTHPENFRPRRLNVTCARCGGRYVIVTASATADYLLWTPTPRVLRVSRANGSVERQCFTGTVLSARNLYRLARGG